jgi:hypothetical protein
MPPDDDPSAWEHRTEYVPEGQSLDPGLRERLAIAGWEQVHVARAGWFGSPMGTHVHFRRCRALTPIRRR